MTKTVTIMVSNPRSASGHAWAQRYLRAGYKVIVVVGEDKLQGKRPTGIFLDDVAETFVKAMGYRDA